MGKRQHSDVGKEHRDGRVGQVKVEDIKRAFEDSSEDDIEIIDRYKTHPDEPYDSDDSDIEVIEPHTPPSRPRVINLVTPERPTIHVKKELTDHAIPRKTTSAPRVKPEPIDVKLESKSTSHPGHRNGPIVTAAEPSPRLNQIYSTLSAAVTAVWSLRITEHILCCPCYGRRRHGSLDSEVLS